MKRELLDKLTRYFQDSPALSAGPVRVDELVGLEDWAGFTLPDSYKCFVATFGGGIVGPLSICGVGASDAMGRGDASAQVKTEFFRRQLWPGTEKWLIISSDLGGNPIGLDKDGKVWLSDHDRGETRLIAETFDEFLETLLQ